MHSFKIDNLDTNNNDCHKYFNRDIENKNDYKDETDNFS